MTAKLCGILNPTPIFSPNNMLVIHFKSDGKNNFQGFKARFTFCSQVSISACTVVIFACENSYTEDHLATCT